MPGTERECLFRFITQPTDVNWGGKVHGGMVMKWIDQVGYACAIGWSGHYSVTVSVGGMAFVRPILIGQLVEVRARIIMTGNTSMHIAVDVESIDPLTHTRTHTTHCVIVFVAVEDDGKPVKVPAWIPATDDDKRLADYATRLRSIRDALDAEAEELRIAG